MFIFVSCLNHISKIYHLVVLSEFFIVPELVFATFHVLPKFKISLVGAMEFSSLTYNQMYATNLHMSLIFFWLNFQILNSVGMLIFEKSLIRF